MLDRDSGAVGNQRPTAGQSIGLKNVSDTYEAYKPTTAPVFSPMVSY